MVCVGSLLKFQAEAKASGSVGAVVSNSIDMSISSV